MRRRVTAQAARAFRRDLIRLSATGVMRMKLAMSRMRSWPASGALPIEVLAAEAFKHFEGHWLL